MAAQCTVDRRLRAARRQRLFAISRYHRRMRMRGRRYDHGLSALLRRGTAECVKLAVHARPSPRTGACAVDAHAGRQPCPTSIPSSRSSPRRRASRATHYERDYAESVDDPEAFWGAGRQAPGLVQAADADQGRQLRPRRLPHPLVRRRRAQRQRQLPGPPLATRGDKTALIFEPTSPDTPVAAHHLPRAARARLQAGQRAAQRSACSKGDRVTIYLPMIPEAAVAMLACARIGAVHSVVFGGFAPQLDRRPRRRLRQQAGHHRRRRPARRQEGAAEGQRRRGAEAARHQHGRDRAGRAPHRRRGRHADAARPLVRRGGRRPAGRHASPSA